MMDQRITVNKVMTERVESVDCQKTLKDAAKQMTEQDVGCLLVTKDAEVVGIITESDIVRRVVAQNMDPASTRVEEVMSFPVYTIDGEESLEKARERMAGHNVRHLLVAHGGKPVGVISARNLIAMRL
jgi:CBS domain-containing protein